MEMKRNTLVDMLKVETKCALSYSRCLSWDINYSWHKIWTVEIYVKYLYCILIHYYIIHYKFYDIDKLKYLIRFKIFIAKLHFYATLKHIPRLFGNVV